MIILRQQSYADTPKNNKSKLPKNEEELKEYVAAEKEKSFEAGKKAGRREATKSGGNRVSRAPERRRENYDRAVRERAKRIKKANIEQKLRKVRENIELNLDELKFRPKVYLRKTKLDIGKALRSKKGKAALISTAALSSAGVGYRIYKGGKKIKVKKREKDLKKKVRGYDK